MEKFFTPVPQKQKKQNIFDSAFLALQSAQNILITIPSTHNADLIASGLVLHRILTQMEKSPELIMSSGNKNSFSWLPYAESIESSLKTGKDFLIELDLEEAELDSIKYTVENNKLQLYVSAKKGVFYKKNVNLDQQTTQYDLIITLGANSFEDLDTLWSENTALFAKTPVLAFTSQKSQVQGAQSTIFLANTSTTSEIITQFLIQNEVFEPFWNKSVATLLLAGVLSATNSFLEANTFPHAFEVASILFKKGADHTFIIEKLFKSRQFQTLQLWGHILADLQCDTFHQLCWTSLAQVSMAQYAANPSDVQNISDALLRHVNEAEISVLFIEDLKKIHIQVRSSNKNHLFESLLFSSDYKTTMVPHGVNIIVPNKTLAEVQTQFMKDIVAFQKKRHQLPAELPLTPINPEKDQQKSEKKQKTIPDQTKNKEWLKNNLPFQVD